MIWMCLLTTVKLILSTLIVTVDSYTHKYCKSKKFSDREEVLNSHGPFYARTVYIGKETWLEKFDCYI